MTLPCVSARNVRAIPGVPSIKELARRPGPLQSPVGQTLFIHAVGREASTTLISGTELAAIVPTESKFVKVTL